MCYINLVAAIKYKDLSVTAIKIQINLLTVTMSLIPLSEESFQATARKSYTGRKSVTPRHVNDENNPDGLYNQLLTLKSDRLKVDQEAKMLKNRIGLLLQEEQRAQKKIEETKRKAKSILELKLKQQQELILKEEVTSNTDLIIESNYH